MSAVCLHDHQADGGKMNEISPVLLAKREAIHFKPVTTVQRL